MNIMHLRAEGTPSCLQALGLRALGFYVLTVFVVLALMTVEGRANSLTTNSIASNTSTSNDQGEVTLLLANYQSIEEELKRYFTLIGWIFVYAVAVYFAASFFAEQDASWHQVVVRDTSFTPSHIVLFYGTMPVYIMIGVAGFIYARTRLPEFASKLSIPYLFAVVGPFMILPNVGYNEWGHAFWLMEEYFTAPLHWGFVVLGWTVLMLGGLAMQVAVRLAVLMKAVDVGDGDKVFPLKDESMEYCEEYAEKYFPK